MIYKFNYTTIPLHELETARIYKLYDKVKNGVKWSELDDKERAMFNELNSPGRLYGRGHYLLLGWVFDISPYLKRYLVNFKYRGWLEFYALSKMQIRETTMNPSYILEIVEL